MGKKKSDEFVLKMYELYNTGLTAGEVGAIYGVTDGAVQSLFKRLNLEARNSKRYDYDRSYFKNIDTPVKSYIVGFLAADAGIDERNRLRIKVSKRDDCILKLILSELKCEIPIKYRTGSKIKGTKYIQSDYCFISIASIEIVSDLMNIGITPRKSLTLSPPKNIPDELIKYFILGYFDGDGTVNNANPKNTRFSFLGTTDFLSFIQNHLVKNAGLTLNNLYNRGSFWQLSWGGAVNAIKFRDYIYDDMAWFPLERKKSKFASAKTIERVYKKGRTVLQLDLSGKFIKEWPGGVSEIVSAPFPCGRNIYDAISKNGATAYGFKWSYKVAINDIR